MITYRCDCGAVWTMADGDPCVCCPGCGSMDGWLGELEEGQLW